MRNDLASCEAYDLSLEDSMSPADTEDDVLMSQGTSSALALLSARAIGVLCGVIKDSDLRSPSNTDFFSTGSKLFTPSLAKMLKIREHQNCSDL